MKLTLLLEVLKTLERRERDTLSDSPGVMAGAQRNSEALKLARLIIDEQATADLLLPLEPITRIEVASTQIDHQFDRELRNSLFCTRKHNCYSTPEPCNGIRRQPEDGVCRCADGGNRKLYTENICVCGGKIEAGIRL